MIHICTISPPTTVTLSIYTADATLAKLAVKDTKFYRRHP